MPCIVKVESHDMYMYTLQLKPIHIQDTVAIRRHTHSRNFPFPFPNANPNGNAISISHLHFDFVVTGGVFFATTGGRIKSFSWRGKLVTHVCAQCYVQ